MESSHRQTLILVALVATALAAALVPVASAEAGKPAPGEQTRKKAMWGPLEFEGRSMFPEYRNLGVGIFQTAVRWDHVAPTRPAVGSDPNDPAYQWPSYLDEAAKQAQAHGMQTMVMLLGAPSWSNGGRSWDWPAHQASDFGDFAAAAARRYPSVKLWMIWGEPNRKPNFGPVVPARWRGKLNKRQRAAPRIYSQMLDAAYGSLKYVDPANLVIGGNTYTSAGGGVVRPYQWIRYMRMPDGSRPRLDMWGHNPFGFDKPNLKSRPSPRGTVAFNDLRRLAKALDRARFRGNRRPKLYLAEWGVPIGFKDRDLLYKLKPKTGKQWIRAAFRITRRWNRIYTLGWIHPVDTDRSSQGLLSRSGARKPGYKAYRSG